MRRSTPISGGDTLAIEIDELRQRDTLYQIQAQVSPTGFVNLPVVGRVMAGGDTVPQFEASLVNVLRDRNVLIDPKVTVNPLFLHKATYSIFGVGVSASNNAPLRAGTFPIQRPDLRILEAINQVGGLNEFVTDVFVFRSYDPPPEFTGEPLETSGSTYSGTPSGDIDEPGEHEAGLDEPAQGEGDSAIEQELFDVVTEDGRAEPETGIVDEESETLKELEPDGSDPFLWVNGEFVPNPAYSATPAGTPAAVPVEPPSPDLVSPAVNWARVAGETSYRVLRIPAEAMRSGDPEANIFVRPGDVIRITSGEVGVYYVMGQVNRVGPYSFNSESITVKRAIAMAGGLSTLAWPDRCTVYRRLGQREQMIQVDLDRIFAGKDPDFEIRRGDIINVGTHPFAPFLRRIRELTLPNPSTNVGYSFMYSRNFADIDSYDARINPANEQDTFSNLFP